MEAPVVHAQEGGHWYSAEGRPVYEVPRSDGNGMRPATLRDARKMGLFPGTTTVIRCADRPGLTNWMVDQGILAALTLPRLKDEPEAAWLRRVKQDSKEQARKAAERGTAIHAAIQDGFEGAPVPEEYLPHRQAACSVLFNWNSFPDWHWWAEKSFSHGLGFGGKVDLHCSGFVCDFKTKEFGPDDDLKTWDEHAMQLAAYREGLKMPNARAAVCYVSVSHPGVARLIEIEPSELERGWECFKSLLSFWQAKNRYWPEMKKAA